ncbi:uncharacterized protein LOC125186283 [Salvia hispanica]|uniref:uncharacterized protein LOC125186283 n=1 Tax=Salvia hispanica TaxID=49212 RepID=UPI002009007D|nr:uncharacterized protein LOC125186283 [Salvia hispanica]
MPSQNLTIPPICLLKILQYLSRFLPSLRWYQTAESATSPCLPKKSPNLNQVPSPFSKPATAPKKTSGESVTAPKNSNGESATDSSGESATESATHSHDRSEEIHGLLAAAQSISAASRGPTVDGRSTIAKAPEIVEIMEFAVSESNQQMQACSASPVESEGTSASEVVWLGSRKKQRRRQASAPTERRRSTDAPTPSERKRKYNKTGTIVGRGTGRYGLYYVDEIAQQSTAMLTHGLTDRQIWLLHRRLGHPSISYLRLLFPELVSSTHVLNCETCVLAKSHRHSFKLNNTREKTPFALVRSDVCGPAPVTRGQGFRYFWLFIDDFSRMTWIYFF